MWLNSLAPDAQINATPMAQWPYIDILVRLALSLVLGLLIGLERERRGKEAGLRTFGFIALLGGLGGALGDNFALLNLGLVGAMAMVLNIQSLRADGPRVAGQGCHGPASIEPSISGRRLTPRFAHPAAVAR